MSELVRISEHAEKKQKGIVSALSEKTNQITDAIGKQADNWMGAGEWKD